MIRFIAAVLAGSLALAPASALAQRGNAGLPDNPGNPIADLQRQVDELRALLNGLIGQPSAVTVNCGSGGTIGAALGGGTGPITITVVGTCIENVDITRDDVVIQGTGGAGVTGLSNASPVIRMDGARRARISGLALTGGDSVVLGTRGSTFDLSSCTVQGGARFGVVANNGSTATVDGCLVTNSVLGLVAAGESAVFATNSTVEDHATGVLASRNSSVRLGQDINSTNVVKPVVVRGNSQNGVSIADGSSAIIVGGSVEDNGRLGIFVGRSSSAQIGVGSLGLMAGVVVQDNGRDGIMVEAGQATIVGSTVSGNDRSGIIVHNGAGARIGIPDGSASYVGNIITANGSTGIHVNGAASAYIGGNDISGNGTDAAAGFGRHGIGVFAASINLAGANSITGNAGAGIFVGRNAGAHIGDTNFGLPVTGAFANVISGNGQLDPANKAGIFAFQGGTADVRDAVITGNYGAGVQAFQAGQVDLRRTQITGSINQATSSPQLFDFNGGHGVAAGFHSTVRVRGTTTVTGNQGAGVRVFNDSGVDFRSEGGSPTVSGNTLANLDCGGPEASASGDFTNVAGGMGSCTGF